MFLLPGSGRDLHGVDPLGGVLDDRHRQPLGPLGGEDAVSILPLGLHVLDGVEQDEDLGSIDLVQVAEPGQVVGLVDGDPHAAVLL